MESDLNKEKVEKVAVLIILWPSRTFSYKTRESITIQLTLEQDIDSNTKINHTKNQKMQKIILITFLTQLCGASTLGRIQRLKEMAQALEVVNNQLGTMDEMKRESEEESFMIQLSRESRAYRSYGKRRSSYICATIIGQKCIPPCRKYHGKLARKCSAREKQQHLIFYLFKK